MVGLAAADGVSPSERSSGSHRDAGRAYAALAQVAADARCGRRGTMYLGRHRRFEVAGAGNNPTARPGRQVQLVGARRDKDDTPVRAVSQRRGRERGAVAAFAKRVFARRMARLRHRTRPGSASAAGGAISSTAASVRRGPAVAYGRRDLELADAVGHTVTSLTPPAPAPSPSGALPPTPALHYAATDRMRYPPAGTGASSLGRRRGRMQADRRTAQARRHAGPWRRQPSSRAQRALRISGDEPQTPLRASRRYAEDLAWSGGGRTPASSHAGTITAGTRLPSLSVDCPRPPPDPTMRVGWRKPDSELSSQAGKLHSPARTDAPRGSRVVAVVAVGRVRGCSRPQPTR